MKGRRELKMFREQGGWAGMVGWDPSIGKGKKGVLKAENQK